MTTHRFFDQCALKQHPTRVDDCQGEDHAAVSVTFTCFFFGIEVKQANALCKYCCRCRNAHIGTKYAQFLTGEHLAASAVMQNTRHNTKPSPSRPIPGDSIVRVGPLMGMVAVMRELGADPEAIFEGSGYTIAQFADPDSELPYATGSRFLARCANATKCPHFGLLVGTRAHPSCLGIAGFLLLNCPDIGTALRSLVQNLDLHDRGGIPTLLIEGDSTQFGYAIHQTNVEAAEHIYDVSIAFACNIMRAFCGVNWSPTEVLLSRRRPPDTAPYRQFYRAPLRFNADRNAIVFPSRWLDHKIPGANELLHRHLEREANELHALQLATIIGDTRRLLRTSLLAGNCTINNIARQLCMHERTLHRRLCAEGTSFQRELDAVRHDFALQLLAGSAMPIARIAAMLNYAGVGSFNRAFKRWTGLTPARWRASNSVSSRTSNRDHHRTVKPT